MYRYDNRVVITLDAGGTNLVFGAMQANKLISSRDLQGISLLVLKICAASSTPLRKRPTICTASVVGSMTVCAANERSVTISTQAVVGSSMSTAEKKRLVKKLISSSSSSEE